MAKQRKKQSTKEQRKRAREWEAARRHEREIRGALRTLAATVAILVAIGGVGFAKWLGLL